MKTQNIALAAIAFLVFGAVAFSLLHKNGVVNNVTPNDGAASGVTHEGDAELGKTPVPLGRRSAKNGEKDSSVALTNQDGVSEPEAISLEGRVIDKEGEGIFGAEIRFRHSPLDGDAASDTEVISNKKGEFRIEQNSISGKPLVLAVSGEGYQDKIVHGITASGSMDIVLIRRTISIAGRVLDTSGIPCPGTQVILWEDNLAGQTKAQTTKSNTDGEYVLGPLGEGLYTLSAKKLGYGDAMKIVFAGKGDDSLSVDLNLSGSTQQFPGLVVDAITRVPLAKVQIIDSAGYETVSGELGRFSLPLPSGTQTAIGFSVEKDGYVKQGVIRPINQSLNQEQWLNDVEPVLLVKGSGGAVRIVNAPNDKSEIYCEFFQPIKNLRDLRLAGKVTKIGDGEFLLSCIGVSGDEAYCVVGGRGLAEKKTWVTEYDPKLTEPSRIPSISMEPGRTIAVSVKNRTTGEGVEGVRIKRKGTFPGQHQACYPDGHRKSVFTELEYEAISNSHGLAVIRGLPLGETCIAVGKEGYVPIHEVAPAGVSKISILLEKEPSNSEVVSGRLLGLTEKHWTLHSPTVTAVDTQGRRFTAGVDRMGTFRVDANSKGPFRVCVNYASGRGDVRSHVTPKWFRVGSTSIEIELQWEKQ